MHKQKLFSTLTLFGIIDTYIYIYIYGTGSKPAYLQIPSILSISFNSVLAVEVVLW